MYSKKEQAEASLYEFLKQSWHVNEGIKEFEHEWYLEELADRLEDCFHRKIKSLLINLPPRKGKSNLISVAFPVWCWLQKPSETFLCASYSSFVSLTLSELSKNIIRSDWFQKNWGDKIKLSRHQNSKSHFKNTQSGCRITTSSRSFISGIGCGIVILDDPNHPSGESDVIREATNVWWHGVMWSRVDDFRTCVRIVVQQRSQNVDDVSGSIMERDVNKVWTRYIVPMEYEKSVVSDFNDIRTIEGELLSCRDNETTLRDAKQSLGANGYIAQFQQRPIPLEGGMFKKDWFRIYPHRQLPDLKFVVQSWDTAMSDKKNASYSACTTWGVFSDQYDNNCLILLSCWRDRLLYPDLRVMVKRLANNYMDTANYKGVSRAARKSPDVIIVEAKATGDPIIQDLSRAGVFCRPFVPNKHGDKDQRARVVSPLIEAGVLWVPSHINNVNKKADFADEFVTIVSGFPAVPSRDYVDTMSQALIMLTKDCTIKHPSDYYRPEIEEDTVRVY